MGKIGIIANPRAGQDVRRIFAHCRPVGREEKADAIRRLIAGINSVGDSEILMMPDRMGIVETALGGLRQRAHIHTRLRILDFPATDTADDSALAARLMAEEGVACLITLGGDGTNRAVATACGETPLIPLSTGTNNAFPVIAEATTAGIAAGLVAEGVVEVGPFLRRAKRIDLFRNGEPEDIALVDVAVCEQLFVGARAISDMAQVREVVVTQGLPTSLGVSAVIGCLAPLSQEEEAGCHAELGDGGDEVRAAVFPGLVEPVAVRRHRRLALGERVALTPLNGTIALDGERHLMVSASDRWEAMVTRRGPRVLDFRGLLAAAARQGVFRSQRAPVAAGR